MDKQMKAAKWGIVRQFATYRAVLQVNDGWMPDDSARGSPKTFVTKREAESYLRRHVGTHFHEFVSRVQS